MANILINAALLALVFLGVVFIAYGVDRYLTKEDNNDD